MWVRYWISSSPSHRLFVGYFWTWHFWVGLYVDIFAVMKGIYIIYDERGRESNMYLLPFRSLTVRPWKMMVGNRSFPFGMVCFQGRTVKLPGGILFSSLLQFLHHVNTNSPLEVFTFASWTAMCAPGSWRPPNMTRARQPTWQMMKGEDDFWWICGSF